MNHTQHLRLRLVVLIVALVFFVAASRMIRADTGTCGGQMLTLPFMDVAANNTFFCSIVEAYSLGLANGTTTHTYDPSALVPREQMAAFITRTHDSAIKRSNRRAALEQWWTSSHDALRSADIGSGNAPHNIVCDGADLWVASSVSGTVSRVRASDGRLLQTWTGATNAESVIACAGRIFVTGASNPGKIYAINPESVNGGTVTEFEPNIGASPRQITFDGTNLWTANAASISKINVSSAADFTFTTGLQTPSDILWDGTNLWVTDSGDDRLKRIDPSNGDVLSSSTLVTSFDPTRLLFDGTNLWVSCAGSNSIIIFRAAGGLSGTYLQTLTGNGLDGPRGMAFDGERILVCNAGGSSVSLFRAADFAPLGSLSVGTTVFPNSACSDGVNFWIVRSNSSDIVRF